MICIIKSMKNSNKQIIYATRQYTFTIDFSKEDYISIQLYDNNGRKASMMISDSVLKSSSITTDELIEQIRKQIIHQGSFKRQLLRLQQNKIVMTFTFPKCKVKSLSFQVGWKQSEQSTKSIECTARYVESLIKNVEARLRSLDRQLEARMDRKLASILSHLEDKYKEIRKRLSGEVQQKIQLAIERMQQYQNINRDIAQRYLQEQCRKLIDSNLRYFDEFRLIKTDLQTSLMNCDLNIKELSHQVSDLRSFVLDHQDKTEDKVDKFAIGLSDLERTVRFTFRQINDQLASLQEPQSLQDNKNTSNKEKAQQQASTTITEAATNPPRKSTQKYPQDEQTTYLPILSQKELKISPSEQTIFLED